jgi:hypothetical protein
MIGIGLSQSAFAFELGLGMSAIEEGDDRLRPGILLHASAWDQYSSRLIYYGRKFGPVTERTLIISAYRHLDIFRMLNNRFLYGGLGLAFMNEQTVIDLPGDKDSENNPNLGFTFGLHGDIPIKGPIFIRASMESHMFLAGLAGVLLANGRKNVVSITSGVKF